MPMSDVHRAAVDSMEKTAPRNTPLLPESLGVQQIQTRERKGVILLVEDDRGDQLLTQEALRDSGRPKQVFVVSDGEEALRYLRRRGNYENPSRSPRPDLVLLDLNMPRVNGRKVAMQAKADPDLKFIPIVVLSTSDYPEDIRYCYEVGVNSYVHKPTNFDDFVRAVGEIERYWLQVVEPPPEA